MNSERTKTVIIADDDASIRTVMSEALRRDGYNVIAVGTGSALWSRIQRGEGDVVITDVVMPDADGLELLPSISKKRPNLPIIVVSAQSTLTTAVRASEQGAFEYIPKPFDINRLTDVVKKALQSSSDGPSSTTIPQPVDDNPLVGSSPAMQEVFRTMARVMGTDLTISIFGESGSGKELVAQALHDMGPRKNAKFVAVNMAAIPRDLIESELFGHEKGAFTGAQARVEGRFEEARGGTLFLDEIGDMPMEAQTRLLRVIQEGEYRAVGGRRMIDTDVRIITATHKDLEQMVRDGTFREDLYYRLNVVVIDIPSLTKRREDIPELANSFLNEAERDGLPAKSFTEGAFKAMMKYNWPGNVRELRNMVRRLCALYSEDVLDETVVKAELKGRKGHKKPKAGENLSTDVLGHLERYFAAHPDDLPPSGLYDRILREVERPLIITSLKATKGNQLKAADLLGINRNTLRKKIRELDIDLDKS